MRVAIPRPTCAIDQVKQIDDGEMLASTSVYSALRTMGFGLIPTHT